MERMKNMVTSKFFDMGQVVVTKEINDIMTANKKFATEIMVSLQRYAVKDWGCLDNEDKKTNDEALDYPEDLYILGAYKTSKGKIWIITNRISEDSEINATTVCFPDER